MRRLLSEQRHEGLAFWALARVAVSVSVNALAFRSPLMRSVRLACPALAACAWGAYRAVPSRRLGAPFVRSIHYWSLRSVHVQVYEKLR